jgi:ketosteroid isomerase-like protein
MTQPHEVSTIETIQNLLNDWCHTFVKKNAKELRRFYSDDVVVFDVVPPLSYQGVDLHCAKMQAWFDNMKGDLTVEVLNATVLFNGELASAFCMTRLTIGDLQDMVRVTLIFVVVNGEWLIAHTHSSVPFPADQPST